MDRLMHLKTSQLNSSSSSELGYDTANDDSSSSLYFSINDSSMDETLHNNSLSNQTNISQGIHQVIEPINPAAESISLRLDDSIPSADTSEDTVITNDGLAQTATSSSVLESLIAVSTYSSSNEPIDQPIINYVGVPKHTTISADNAATSSEMSFNTHMLEPSVVPMNNIPNERPMVIANDDEAITGQHKTDTDSESVLSVRTESSTITIDEYSPVYPLRPTLVRFLDINKNSSPNDISTRSTIVKKPNRCILSSWNSMSRKSIVPKPILKKSTSAEESYRKNLMNSGTQTARKSMLRKFSPRKSVAGPSGLSRRESIAPQTSFKCEICAKSFLLKSTLAMHKAGHSIQNTLTNCKYCDRTFQKSIALSTHLKENCEKIPAAARKKILTGDFNRLNSKV